MMRCAILSAGVLLAAGGARGMDPQSFHLMQIERVVGGVNGDTSAQAVQLRMRSFGQNFVSNGRLMAYDAEGNNPVVLIDFKTNVNNGEIGDRVLIVTTNLKNFTEPVVEGDFTFTNPIPDAYLQAGRITFEDNAGSQILWSLAVGGDSYTGSTKGSVTNDDDGDFGPAFDGAFPTDGAAMVFGGTAQDKSHANNTDYSLTNALALLTNNDGDEFQVVLPPPDCYPDFTDDGTLDLFDFLAFVNAFNALDPAADCDENFSFDLFDFLCFTNAFNAGC